MIPRPDADLDALDDLSGTNGMLFLLEQVPDASTAMLACAACTTIREARALLQSMADSGIVAQLPGMDRWRLVVEIEREAA